MSSLGLIHGGVHGAWCWERMIEPLRARGHDVQAFDLPARGADAARAGDRIAQAVDEASEPAVLVAHTRPGTWSEIVRRSSSDGEWADGAAGGACDP